MITIGIIGKTNVGKSTFFAAATMLDVKIENRPFVTIEPNIGIGYLKIECVHKEFNVKCNPRNSFCLGDYRFIPVKLVDVAGLIPGAHEGRGLGNKFLDDLRQADVLIHIVDSSGSTNDEGIPVEPGSRNPEEDIKFVEYEIDEWFYSILSRDWEKFARTTDLSGKDPVDALLSKVSGISVTRSQIIETLRETKLENVKLMQWSKEDLRRFSDTLRRVSKPIIIAANKADLPAAKEFIRKLKDKYKFLVPTSAEAELALRRASKAGLIEYIPGERAFNILKPLSEKQKSALDYIKTNVLDIYGSTGIQEILNKSVFEVLNMIAVYPVEDEKKLTDRNGNILPDVFLLKKGSTPRDLAASIHTELAKGFLYAYDVRRKTKVGEDYILQHRDVIKIYSTTAKP